MDPKSLDGKPPTFETLDPSFGGDGVVQTEVESPSIGNALAIQSNGRILVAGNAIFGAADPEAATRELKALANSAIPVGSPAR